MKQKATDIQVVGVELYCLPVKTRVPLKFGAETLTEVTCARARVSVKGSLGRQAEGWGETPLSVQWVWPSQAPYAWRFAALKEFCLQVAAKFSRSDAWGHPLEIGQDFQEHVLPGMWREWNRRHPDQEPMPWLAALVCFSMLDLALHDAYGQLHQLPVFETYNSRFMSRDLAAFLEPAQAGVSFAGKYPQDFLLPNRRDVLRAWHLVGGLDPLEPADLTGAEPNDGYPLLLGDWIKTDGLKCLKIKLKGTDAGWDLQRLARVAKLGLAHGAEFFSADFNCLVQSPDYVTGVLDQLEKDEPRCFERLLYVEQPFPYDLEAHRIDVHVLSARKPLFLDESAHDWRLVRLGRELGWNGVALKTCKTLSGALLTAVWAKAHQMPLMVQDLTNPMMAQISHLLLAGHLDTIMGVETNCIQFYPDASLPEAAVHPGAYRRRNGNVDISTIRGYGLGYRLAEINRPLPLPEKISGPDQRA